MLLNNRVTLMLAASTLMVGVTIAPPTMATESTSIDSGKHMMKPHTGLMKPHAGAMKGHAMKGDAMKGHGEKGDAMKGDAMKSTAPAQ
jgi:pentapeptide MXKDX repeat protein